MKFIEIFIKVQKVPNKLTTLIWNGWHGKKNLINVEPYNITTLFLTCLKIISIHHLEIENFFSDI
jgi:hypothetical protein